MHSAFLCLGQNCRDDVEIPVVRSAGLLQHGVAIELGVRERVITPVEKLFIGLLNPMIGERRSRDLPACQTSPVSEGGEKEGIDRTLLLQDIEDPPRAFIGKRYCSHLDAHGSGVAHGFAAKCRCCACDRNTGCDGSHRGGAL